MLYSIIPPILIVISLAGIVLFLIKKAPEVARLEDIHLNGEAVPAKKSFWAKITRRENEEERVDFSHKVLLFLEKITKKLKVFLLKLENIFTAWGESFRNKRKAREEEKIAQLEEIVEKKDILEKKEEIEIRSEVVKIKEYPKKEIVKPVVKPTVKPAVKPIVKPVVKPVVKKDKKEILESILVERIAANPKDTEAYERLGEYYLEIENLNYAKECFKQVLKLDPQNESTRNKMRKLEKMFGK